jgi:hypothetical protein
MWGDRHLVALPDQARLLWCYLLTGNNEGVPGLWRGGVGTYSDAMRWDHDAVMGALDALIRATFIEYDMEAQLLRVPGAPKYRPCTNANVLKGWYRRWLDVTESPLKYTHILSIRNAVKERPWFKEGWEITFGQVKAPTASKQVPLFLVSNPERSAQTEISGLESSERPLERPSERNLISTTISTETDTDTNTNTDTPAREKPRVANAIERGMIAGELWRLQEELRAELAPGVKPRENPTGQDLRPITEALEIYTREELENALRVNAATAANKPEKMEYFNGYSNWHPNSLRRTVGQVVPTGSGRIAVRGRKKFKGGRVI